MLSNENVDYSPTASSPESHPIPSQGKRRRLQPACDHCRRRRSNGIQATINKCSKCAGDNVPCTYVGSETGCSRTKSISTLETQLAESEALVRHLRAELALAHTSSASSSPSPSSISISGSSSSSTQILHPSPSAQDNMHLTPTIIPSSSPHSLPDGAAASLYIMRAALRAIATPPWMPPEETIEHFQLGYKPMKPHSTEPEETQRWLGKSSSAPLIKIAVDLKADVVQQELQEVAPEHQLPDNAYNGGARWTSRRMQYWQRRPYLPSAPHATTTFDFPPQPLMFALVDLYFTHQNVYIPLLHRPTFEREVSSGLHLRDDAFAATLLLVCAIGSRWSNDPGIAGEGLTCGWRWFNQTLKIPSTVGDHLFGQARLYELQYFSLAVIFLEGSSASQACWMLVGFGFRLAQDIGVHRQRQKGLKQPPSVPDELFKRALWVLIYLDGQISSSLGRTCETDYLDLDIERPLEVADEFWEDPVHPFEQPRGVPSTVTFFNCLLRLNHILSVGLTFLYPPPQTRRHLFINSAWEEYMLVDLDSALNDWLNRVPEHLRWDPARENQLFFDQSVALHAAYFHLQILIHRPFIPMLRKSATTALPSLAICTNAARSCANIVDIQHQRNGTFPAPLNLGGVFTSAMILLLNVWSIRRKGLPQDVARELTHVQKCMQVVKLCEVRDILSELASVGHLPLPTTTDLSSSSSNVSPENSNTNDTIDMDPAQATRDLGFMLDMVDTMWANAPVGLDADVWGTYLNNFHDTPHGQGEGMMTAEY
ncbi:Zn(2)-C6 fungal-type domain-containing protein [Favolaschia claudopus]|uniref:Zn(2)-C6 fungal-type domain-containing protein n=1 Tax=Favolaschia claudopus TaxID=2862362 RepID=A0AAV9Z9D7_9AGAR